jgi:hypothetical protein
MMSCFSSWGFVMGVAGVRVIFVFVRGSRWKKLSLHR